MSATKHPRMTADEFIAWAMTQPEGARYELEDGEVVAMSPERMHHALTKALIFRRLEDAIALAGLSCMAIPDGVGVRIDASTLYEPDVMVRCPETAADVLQIDDPMVIVEVASPSTANRDAGPKFADYFRISSLRHYLLVLPNKRLVIHHERGPGGDVMTKFVSDGVLRLDPPGITVADFWPKAVLG